LQTIGVNFSDDESNFYYDGRTNSASLLLSTLVSAFDLFKNLLNKKKRKRERNRKRGENESKGPFQV